MYGTVALASEHWCSSVFANADFDLQLKKHGIHHLIVVGLIAHACIEAAVRHEAEFGYEVRVVRDACGPDENDARRSQHQYAGLQHRHRHDKRAPSPCRNALGSWRRADALGHDCAVIPMSNGPRVRCRL